MNRQGISLENFKQLENEYPIDKINEWKDNGTLPIELKNSEFSFLKREGDYVYSSKYNTKIHISLFEKIYNKDFHIGGKIKEGQTVLSSGAYYRKQNGKILVKYSCHVMSLDNIKDILNEL